MKRKGYILEGEGNGRQMKRSIRKKISDYVKYHYVSTLGYLASTFLFADGSYKAFIGDIDVAKDELLLGFAIGGISKGYKSGFELPIKKNKKEEILERNYSEEAVSYAKSLLKDVIPNGKFDFISGPQVNEIKPLDFLYEQFEINRTLKEEVGIDSYSTFEDRNDTDIGEKIVKENRELIEKLQIT